jgi:guanylate kinase
MSISSSSETVLSPSRVTFRDEGEQKQREKAESDSLPSPLKMERKNTEGGLNDKLVAARDYKPLVIMGPSGVGKGTLVKMLYQKYPGKFSTSVSHTTRGAREGEVDGKHYHFTSREQMQADVDEGLFVESAVVHGNLYGTSIQSVIDVGQMGAVCILEIDLQGAISIFERYQKDPASSLDCYYVFIHPPEIDELLLRLERRNSETKKSIDTRMQTARVELQRIQSTEAKFIDNHLINDDLDDCFQELSELISGWYEHLTAPAEENSSSAE